MVANDGENGTCDSSNSCCMRTAEVEHGVEPCFPSLTNGISAGAVRAVTWTCADQTGDHGSLKHNTELSHASDTEILAGNNKVNDDYQKEGTRDPLQCCCCCGGRSSPCDKFYSGNRDAMGFALDSVPRGVTIVGGLFLLTALLRLAKEVSLFPKI